MRPRADLHSAHAVKESRSATERVERKLGAILTADIAGYSRLMGADEEGTLAQELMRRGLTDCPPKWTRGKNFGHIPLSWRSGFTAGSGASSELRDGL
jgi:hypothetical protein